MNLTKIEVLLDKIVLLQETLKTQGEMDKVDLQLLRRYANQLTDLVDEQLGTSGVQATPTVIATPASSDDFNSDDDMPTANEIIPAFSFSLSDEEEALAEESPELTPADVVDEAAIRFFAEEDDRETDPSVPAPQLEEPIPQPNPLPPVKEPAASALFAEEEDDDSLNDRYKAEETDLLNKLKKQPIRSLQQEIDLNQKFWFTNELLQGDGARFNQLLVQIDKASDIKEATALLTKELDAALYEEEKAKVFHKLLDLVERRFMP